MVSPEHDLSGLTFSIIRSLYPIQWSPSYEANLEGIGNLSRVGGGGVLSLEKGTDCGPTATELWLSRAKIVKKGELSSHYECA